MMTLIRSLSRALCVTVVCAGCSASHVFQPEDPPLAESAAQGICQDVNAKRPDVTSFRIMAESTVTAGRESASFRYVIVARDPDDMRIDLLPVEGAFTLGMLIAQGDEVTVLNTQDKTYKRSKDKSAIFEEFLGLRGVSSPVIRGIVTGIPPVFDCERVSVFEGPRESVVLLDRDGRVAWRVDSETGRVRAFDILGTDDDSIQVAGTLYYSTAGNPASMSLDVYQPHEAHGILLFKRMTLNPVLADEIFLVPIPASYQAED